jgi:hypothetical protein
MAITSIKTGSSFTNLVKYDSFLGPNSAYIPPSFESIATVTATGGQTTLSFTSIPQTYTHLQIRGIARRETTGASVESFELGMNSDSGSNFTTHQLYGNGTTVTAFGQAANTYDNSTIGWMMYGTATTGMFGAIIIDIHDYSSTVKNKTRRAFSGADSNAAFTGGQRVGLVSSLWMSTSAVTSLQLYANGNTWAAGSTFALYGIKGA